MSPMNEKCGRCEDNGCILKGRQEQGGERGKCEPQRRATASAFGVPLPEPLPKARSPIGPPRRQDEGAGFQLPRTREGARDEGDTSRRNGRSGLAFSRAVLVSLALRLGGCGRGPRADPSNNTGRTRAARLSPSSLPRKNILSGEERRRVGGRVTRAYSKPASHSTSDACSGAGSTASDRSPAPREGLHPGKRKQSGPNELSQP
ncbi:hypothetical protein SKAU_G00272790 [Synaphobranchus kaupii]|uniref:Uncharacterized protein n=1 Tax=Synaphobranchus kaupii TaxID=118154 RepID=A0A9Q1IPU6_SYNKA|nr:hypothetical protein SKAU_G00272790 [Synaphobranchus kaupii]